MDDSRAVAREAIPSVCYLRPSSRFFRGSWRLELRPRSRICLYLKSAKLVSRPPPKSFDLRTDSNTKMEEFLREVRRRIGEGNQ